LTAKHKKISCGAVAIDWPPFDICARHWPEVATTRIKEFIMAILIGDTAPDFEAETTEGRIRFHDYIDGGWAVLFSHPKNFTPVCTTELGYTAKLKPEFDKRGVKVLGLSVDKLENHAGWAADIAETQGATLNFPLISDVDGEVARKYDMIHPNADNSLTVRSVFVIGPDKKVKLKIEYPASTGRNFDEILRVIDSLQLTAKHQVATPVNWKSGEDVIIVPAVSDEAAREKYPEGWKTLKPYLRIVPQPRA
jgi:alkyl hydroperoxide reductase subunit AhpC